MSRVKLFIENFLIYGLGGIINKIIPLIMLPIITRLMPDTFYFGLNDLSNVIISFGSALAIMGMYDAMFRMFFEKEDENYKKDICSTAFFFTCITSSIIFIFLVIFRVFFANVVLGDEKFVNLIWLSAVSILIGANNSIISAPTRMANKKLTYLIINLLSPLISYGISIPLLMNGQYVIALPLASIIASLITITAYYILNRKWFSLRRYNKNYLKQMLKIALPLLPNFIIYWVFDSSDRLMIANILGNDQNGVYAIGAKLGHISNLIYTAFSGGWQYFAFSTMNDNDQVKMTSNIFEYLGVIAFIATIFMMAFSDLIFKILFTGDYTKGTIVAPYLFLAPLLLMLYQTIANQFLVIKKTWPNMVILGSGAVFNIIANLVLINKIGIEGAAIATLLGYIVSLIVCVIVLTKLKQIAIEKRFIYISCYFLAFSILWRLVLRENLIISIVIGIIVSVIICFYYRDVFVSLYKNLKEKKANKVSKES